ncbi:MAG TPA: GntR family transcriptional regulator [Gemmatimonadaceae bacterium]|nr:GntR family transcriptional regulator [Gemmatimonadaceae bacterium]
MRIDPAASTPLYQQVAADLRRRIVTGEIAVGARVPTHRELALDYGVSLITINKALAGLVSDGVLHSRVGRGTFVAIRPPESHDGRGRVLGFVLRDLSSPFFSLVANAAQRRADELGFGLIFSSSSFQLDREDEQIQRFRQLGVLGLIIVSMNRTYRLSPAIRELHDQGLPYVMVSYTHGDDVPLVAGDVTRAGVIAAEHLLGLGRRRFAYMGDRIGSVMFERRSSGYLETLAAAGVPVAPEFVFQYPYEGEWNDYESGYAIGERVAAMFERPDAMYTHNDLGALGFEDALLDHGIRVPEDVAIVGLDDIELAARARVPLTTVHVPTDRIGALAVDHVVARIRGQPTITRQLLEPRLVVRRSCGAPFSGSGPPDARSRRSRLTMASP